MARLFNRHKRSAYRIARKIWLENDGLHKDIEELRPLAEEEARRIVAIDVMTIMIIIELIIKIWQLWQDMKEDNPPVDPPVSAFGLNFEDPQDEECCGNPSQCDKCDDVCSNGDIEDAC